MDKSELINRAKSDKDFISKMTIVAEEANEVMIKEELLMDLKQEASEILSIIVAGIKTKGKV